MSTQPENLSAFLDGELTAVEIAEIEAELSADPAVRAELEALESVVDFVRSNGPLEAPMGFADAVFARVDKEAAPTGGTLVWLRRPMGIPLEALAVAAAAVFVLVFALNNGDDATGASTVREVFEPAEVASPAIQVEVEEQQADGIAQVEEVVPRDWEAASKPRPKARPKPSAAVPPAPTVTTGEVERYQSKGLLGSGTTEEGEAEGAKPVLSVVPYRFTLHSENSDVLKQLDRLARRHGGELQTSTGTTFQASTMSAGTTRVFVAIPNTQLSAFTSDMRKLGETASESTRTFYPGDQVKMQIDVDYDPGTATYAPSAESYETTDK